MSGHNEPYEERTADWRIEDPGDAGAIDVRQSGVCNMSSASGNETRTLAIPTFVGQWLMLVYDTEAGTQIAVTVAQAINQTGDTVITFTDAGGMAYLVAGTVGGALRWRLVSISTTTNAEGVTLA